MANKILLPNGCSMSTPSVNPKNWKTGGQALLSKHWRVQYYFYDPLHPKKRKQVVVKGMNEYSTLKERRDVTKTIIEDEIRQNQRGYNPILKRFVDLVDENAELHENLPFLTAFRISLKRLDCEAEHKQNIKVAINRLEKASIKLRSDDITISSLKRRDFKRIIQSCNFPDPYYNKCLSYFSSLFRELLEEECCETNIIRDIRRKKVVVKEREVMSTDDHKSVIKYLKYNHYEFYRYAIIFFYSGARSAELLRIQRKDVDLENQEFKVLIKKGGSYKEAIKVIIKEALPFWTELLKGAKPNDYIFSRGLEPGKDPIQRYQITKRWYRLVKKSDDIKDESGKTIRVTADFYSMKHSFLDSLDEDVAQKMASHTNARTTSIYRVNQDKRDREALKELEVKLKVV